MPSRICAHAIRARPFALCMSEKRSKVKWTLDRIRWNRFMTWIGRLLLITQTPSEPIPVAARSKASVCSRSLAGIVVLNPTGGMDDCYELCYHVAVSVSDWSLVRRNPTERAVCVWVWSGILRSVLCVSECDQESYRACCVCLSVIRNPTERAVCVWVWSGILDNDAASAH